MANKVVISEALNELSKGIKVKPLDGEIMLESKKKPNKKALKESVEFASVDYQNLIRDLADRVENPDDEDNIHDAIMDAMDDGLIYNEDLWTAIHEFASPGEVLNALTERGTDIYTYIYEDIYECLHNNLLESKRTLRRKSLREEKFSNKTSQGWTIVKKFKDLDDGRTHVIADRGSGEYPFAVGLGYNEKTGSWGQGMYDYKTAEEAENALKHNNRYHPYNVELIESMIRVPRSEIKKYEATDELNKRLKDYQIAHKTSGIPSAYALGLECVGYSGGSYGCNGHLYRDIKTGELLGTTGRDKFIYITENQDDITEEMSPEDKADSEVLRNVYNKVSRRTDAKVTDKEQKVLDKLGVSVQRKTPNNAYHHKNGDILDKSGGSLSQGVKSWGEIPDEVNLAGMARKRPERAEKRNSLDRPDRQLNHNNTETYFTPGHDSEFIHGEISPEQSKRTNWVGTDTVPTRDTKRHPYLTKERQRQATNMYKPMVDMKDALRDKKISQNTLDNVDKQYAKDVSYANDVFQRNMRNADETRTRNRQSSEQGLADANNKINTLLKRK